MPTPVTIRVKNDAGPSVPVAGVVVQFYTAGLSALQTSGVTDSSGEVTVSLPAGDYDLLFYKFGVSVLPKQPQRITVDAGPATNVFLVACHEKTLPESISPALCRISGYLLGADGKMTRDSKLTLSAVKEIIVQGTNAITPAHPLFITPDENGYYEFDLMRGVAYDGYFVLVDTLIGVSPAKLDILVPDLPSCRLDTLLFPLPVSLEFSESAISLVHGADPDSSVEVTTLFTDGSERARFPPFSSVLPSIDNPDVVSAAILDGKLILTPNQAGTATITATRSLHEKVQWLPSAPEFTAGSIVVTVT